MRAKRPVTIENLVENGIVQPRGARQRVGGDGWSPEIVLDRRFRRGPGPRASNLGAGEFAFRARVGSGVLRAGVSHPEAAARALLSTGGTWRC